MKNILLATTALVASASFASADVNLTGYAEMGLYSSKGMHTDLHTDVDVTFTMAGEADNGLTFGANIDLDEVAGGIPHGDQVGETLFIAYGNMKLTAGDTDGAFDAALTEVALAGGSLTDNETTHAGYNGNAGLDPLNGGQVATFSYSADSFTGYVSASLTGGASTTASNNVFGVGVSYSMDLGDSSVGVGLGHQSATGQSITGISLNGSFGGGFSAAVNFSTKDGAGSTIDEDHVGLGIGYSQDALAVGLNWGEYSDKGGVAGATESGIGLAASYDLGGGLSAQLGMNSGETKASAAAAAVKSDSWSLGLAMSF